MADLGNAIKNIWESDFVQDNPKKQYSDYYNAEYLAVAQYINGGARPDPSTFSKLGKGLVEAEDHRREHTPVPTPGLPFTEAQLRPGYTTIKVNPSDVNIGGIGSPVAGGNDVFLDFQGLTRSVSPKIFGGANQRIKGNLLRANITAPRTDSTKTQRNALRVYAADASGAEHISFSEIHGYGSGLADGVTWDMTENTVLTIQKLCIEYPNVNVAEPSEHVDAIQCQGKIKRFELGLSTINLAGVQAGNDRGKGLMLNRIDQRPFEVVLKKVNFKAGNLLTGAAIFASYATIIVKGEDVYFDKQGTQGNTITSGSGAFSPQNFTLAAGECFWPAGSQMQLRVKVGVPSGGDYYVP